MSGGPTRIALLDVSVPDADLPLKAATASASGLMKAGDRAQIDAALGNGVVPSARFLLDTQPTNGDTVVVGGHTFKFVTSLAAQNTFTQMKIGASDSGASARTLLIHALNGVVDAANITYGTVAVPNVLADLIDTNKVRARLATAPGGTALPGRTSVAVSSSMTHAADVWDQANLNDTGQPANASMGLSSVTISAAMITAGKVFVEFPFTPAAFVASINESTGNMARNVTTDTLTIEGNAVKITLAGGASPNLQANDIVSIFATS
jgi:hypothetical protein